MLWQVSLPAQLTSTPCQLPPQPAMPRAACSLFFAFNFLAHKSARQTCCSSAAAASSTTSFDHCVCVACATSPCVPKPRASPTAGRPCAAGTAQAAVAAAGCSFRRHRPGGAVLPFGWPALACLKLSSTSSPAGLASHPSHLLAAVPAAPRLCSGLSSTREGACGGTDSLNPALKALPSARHTH